MSAVVPTVSGVSASAEILTVHFFIELTVIILISRLVAWFAQAYLGQTKSVGEIMAGLALGPSVFGFLFPETFSSFFNDDVSTAFTIISQFGLLLLMFHMGLEFDVSLEFKERKKAVVLISVLGIAFPFGLGVATASWFWGLIDSPTSDLLEFSLFMGVAMSITAIPILGRIFMELGLEHTRIAALTIGAAAIDDMIGWILLGLVSALALSNLDGVSFFIKIALLICYVFLMLSVIGPFARKKIDSHIQSRGKMDISLLSFLIVVLMISALITSKLGVFAIAGGIIVGIALQKSSYIKNEWQDKVAPLVYTVLLPVFFTYTGLRTDIGSLSTMADVWAAVVLCIIAFGGKFLGGYIAARISGEANRDAIIIGVCMNTRALMELIVINVAYDLGILPKKIFTMLVFMALISTFITTPIIKILLKNQLNRSKSAAVLQAKAL
ncbi:MAG TPA: cation:proton antiporter [Alcaligenes sp.]|nr:cation:proton antiporter [Alcaligenes faecalis]HRL20277.1 cation:proton antiporter [Alcaligenes sp.]